MITNGSISIGARSEVLEKETRTLIIVQDGYVVDQVRMKMGDNLYTDFVGMSMTDVDNWVNEDMDFASVVEHRSIINVYVEEDHAESKNRTLSVFG